MSNMRDIDVNKPVENPELIALFDRRSALSTSDPAFAQIMNEIFGYIANEAAFLTVIHMDKENIKPTGDGVGVLKKSTSVTFEMLMAPDNSVFIALFTDWQNLRKWDRFATGEVSTMIMTFDQIFGLMRDNVAGIAINPFSDNLIITRPQLFHMKEVKDLNENGHTTRVIQEETKVMIGEPKVYPQQMVDAICAYAKTNRNIKAIYLKHMIQGAEQSFLLAVDFKGNRDEVFGNIARAGQPYLPQGMYIDMIAADSDLFKAASDGKPFYKKKGLFS